MNYEERYNELIDAIKEMQETNPHDEGLQNWVHDNVPELTESEDERIRRNIIAALKGEGYYDCDLTEKCIAWVKKQVPFDKEKMLIGARKDVASSIITYLDRNTLGMCLSNMECEDLVNAVVDSDWSKVYNHMKKKLEQQGDKSQGKTAIEAIKEEKVDNANKVEPKFHEGEWVVDSCGYVWKIKGNNNRFYFLEGDGIPHHKRTARSVRREGREGPLRT